MNRMTQKDEQGNWCLKGVAWEQLRVGQTITKETSEKLYGALWKLKDYEDTGLTPEEIVEDMCVDLGPEKTGDIRRYIREIQKLLKQTNLRI